MNHEWGLLIIWLNIVVYCTPEHKQMLCANMQIAYMPQRPIQHNNYNTQLLNSAHTNTFKWSYAKQNIRNGAAAYSHRVAYSMHTFTLAYIRDSHDIIIRLCGIQFSYFVCAHQIDSTTICLHHKFELNFRFVSSLEHWAVMVKIQVHTHTRARAQYNTSAPYTSFNVHLFNFPFHRV